MSKNFRALINGYILFKVNDKVFFYYEKASDYAHTLRDDIDISFNGLHIFKGWYCFWVKSEGRIRRKL